MSSSFILCHLMESDVTNDFVLHVLESVQTFSIFESILNKVYKYFWGKYFFIQELINTFFDNQATFSAQAISPEQVDKIISTALGLDNLTPTLRN